ncbi:hypothetical protein HMPREF9946_03101 [Acetobacteraceae bacterium AT-5844]|nr:hypothetical protein HMPREF9946_03101 [Acetobacteraceae bacterium AT-5844]
MHVYPILQRAWQTIRDAFALSNDERVSDKCHAAMREIETAMMIIERGK